MARYLLLILLLAGCGSGDPRPAREELTDASAHLDVLVVLIDAAAAAHLTPYGYVRDTTPRLAQIARDGVVFEAAYAQASATPLSVFSWMTSRYPNLTGGNRSATELAARVDPRTSTLADRLAASHPQRGAFVANQWISTALGFDQGFTHFDEVFALPAPGDYPRADLVTRRVLDWWSEIGDDPRFTYVHYLEPHEPYTPPEPFRSKFDPQVRGLVDGTRATLEPWHDERPDEETVRNTVALYDGNLAYVDQQIGRLVDFLRERGRWDRTLFVLLSDHGEAFWQHGVRGHGQHVYEEFVRVPLIVRVPGVPGLAGHRVERVVELVDLVPTLTELAGVPVEPSSMAGRSLVPLLVRDADATAFDADLAYFRNHDGTRLENGVRRGPFKFIRNFDERANELYDLRDDPGELLDRLQQGYSKDLPYSPIRTSQELLQDVAQWSQRGSGVDDGVGTGVANPDSMSAEARERLKAIGYFR